MVDEPANRVRERKELTIGIGMKTKTQVRKENESDFPEIPIPKNWAEAWEERKVVHTFDDGWTIEVSERPNDRYLDGKHAGVYSCIFPGYGHRFTYIGLDGNKTEDPWGDIYLASGLYMILSLRDPDGKPHGHMTFGEATAVAKAVSSVDYVGIGKVGAYLSHSPGWKNFAPHVINEGEWFMLECVMGYNSGPKERCKTWYDALPRPKWAEGLDFEYMRETCSKVLKARNA